MKAVRRGFEYSQILTNQGMPAAETAVHEHLLEGLMEKWRAELWENVMYPINVLSSSSATAPHDSELMDQDGQGGLPVVTPQQAAEPRQLGSTRSRNAPAPRAARRPGSSH